MTITKRVDESLVRLVGGRDLARIEVVELPESNQTTGELVIGRLRTVPKHVLLAARREIGTNQCSPAQILASAIYLKAL